MKTPQIAIKIKWYRLEPVLYGIILYVALLSRLINLGEPTMDHYGSITAKFSYDLYKTGVLNYSPLDRGPLMFYTTAFIFRMFGDSDFTARLFPALMGVCVIMLPRLLFERWLGKTAAFLASVLLIIDPVFLYYNRSSLPDTPTLCFVLLAIYAIFAYLQGRVPHQPKYLLLLAISIALALSSSETALFHFGAIFVIFAIFWLCQIFKLNSRNFRLILSGLTVSLLILTSVYSFDPSFLMTFFTLHNGLSRYTVFAVVGVSCLLVSITLIFIRLRTAFFLIMAQNAMFDVLMLSITLLLPWLAALPFYVAGNSLYPEYDSTLALMAAAPLILLAIVVGVCWKPQVWLICFGAFYAIVLFFFTTHFTNLSGMFSGWVGTLGQIITDQLVWSGSQPNYYYLLVQFPIYEFLPVMGSLTAFVLGVREILSSTSDKHVATKEMPFIVFVGLWTLFMVLIFTITGRKMPWLTMNMSVPMIFWTAWAVGHVLNAPTDAG